MTELRNIFIVGAAKAGTTSLYYKLVQHAQVCAPVVKEPNYFSNIDHESDITHPGTGPGDSNTVWTKTKDDYQALYKVKNHHQFGLDASVSYLYSRRAADYIAEYNSEAKIIIVLRNPVQRAWSHYKHLVRDNREKCSFEEALKREERRIQKGWEFSWHLKQMGLYSQQIQRYFDHFSRNNIHIILFDEIRNSMEHVIENAARFAGLPHFNYTFERKAHNVSGIPRSNRLSGLVSRVAGYKAAINKVIPPRVTHRFMQVFRAANTRKQELLLADETKKQLTAYFRDDIMKTQRLINRDLTHWLT